MRPAPSLPDLAGALAALRELWDTGTRLVSAGTLGMTWLRCVLDDAQAAAVATRLGLRWDPQGGWIVLDKRP